MQRVVGGCLELLQSPDNTLLIRLNRALPAGVDMSLSRNLAYHAFAWGKQTFDLFHISLCWHWTHPFLKQCSTRS